MFLAAPFLLALGLLVPGYFVARFLRSGLLWPSSFLISLLVLFHAIFWLGIFHVPLTAWSILPLLIAVSAVAAWAARGAPSPVPRPNKQLFTRKELLPAAGIAAVLAALAARSAASPLLGFDMRFRWDFLAQRVFAQKAFDFYPPLSAADFHQYFYPDGIPPLISFANFWLYTSAGQYLPVLIALLVAAQFACTIAFTWGAARALYSPRAGILAAALLAACPLYFRATVLGQETGMTALAIAATLYFLVTAGERDTRAMILAGLAAALCALSREYGWIALGGGLATIAWKRQPAAHAAIFSATAAVVAGPWYLRNLIRCGNPFYSLRFLQFAVNPVHDGIMQYYRSVAGVARWTGGTWAAILAMLLGLAALQMLAGIPGLFRRFHEHGFLAVMAALGAAVWLVSVGYTSGGIEVSTRVLSPCMVVLSLSAAGWLDQAARSRRREIALLVVLLACMAANLVQGSVYPESALDLPAGQWIAHAFRPVSEPAEFQIAGQVTRLLPPGSRLLSENAYLHAALLDKGVDVVPVWSPEVRFLFSAPPEEAARRLAARNIATLSYYPGSLNTAYLASASPFYAAAPRLWVVRAQVPRVLYLLGPKTQ